MYIYIFSYSQITVFFAGKVLIYQFFDSLRGCLDTFKNTLQLESKVLVGNPHVHRNSLSLISGDSCTPENSRTNSI